MGWWIAAAAGLLAVAGLGAAAVWAASAFWVHIISARWNAMCADEEPPRSD